MIIDDILKKRSLSKIDREYVLGLLPKKIPTKKSEYKQLIKKIRNKLNKVYGVFWLNNKFDLESHQSTKERIKIYPELYKRIFQITGEPKIILDLGCGLNPLSYKSLGCNPYSLASEWNKKDCELLEKWFKENNIKGGVVQFDLRKRNNYPKADVCFLFKVLGIFEDHKIDEQIIKSLNCKWAVVSFSTKALKGHKMNYPKQGWFQRMLKRLNLTYTKLEFENEVFYVVKLSSSVS